MCHVRRFCVYALAILLFTPLLAQNNDLATKDGNEWITLSSLQKLGYIQGFISGISLMHRRAVQLPLMPFKNLKEPTFQQIIEMVTKDADPLLLYEITTGQLTEGVDAFYSDFSTRKIRLFGAIYVVKLQINGADPDLLSAQIRYLKLRPTTSREVTIRLFEKAKPFNYSTQACFDAGKITVEELLQIGYFVNKEKRLLSLFCYGDY